MEQIYINAKQVGSRYGVSSQTIWRWVNKKEFPKPIQLASGTTRWRVSDIEQYEEEKHLKGYHPENNIIGNLK